MLSNRQEQKLSNLLWALLSFFFFADAIKWNTSKEMALCALCHNLVYTKRSQVDRYWLPCTHTQHTLHAQKNNSNNLHFSSSTFFIFQIRADYTLFKISSAPHARNNTLVCVCVPPTYNNPFQSTYYYRNMSNKP